jgi:hypothetical protein
MSSGVPAARASVSTRPNHFSISGKLAVVEATIARDWTSQGATAKNGTAKVRVRFTKGAKRSLARKRSVRLTIRIKAGATRSVNVTLRRA